MMEFHKQIRGGLRHAIHDHGPITLDLIPSASKRIERCIFSVLKSEKLKEMSNDDILKDKDKEISRLQNKIKTQSKTINDLLNKLEATGTFKRSGKFKPEN